MTKSNQNRPVEDNRFSVLDPAGAVHRFRHATLIGINGQMNRLCLGQDSSLCPINGLNHSVYVQFPHHPATLNTCTTDITVRDGCAPLTGHICACETTSEDC